MASQKQRKLTEQIQAFDVKRNELQSTLSMNFDPAPGFTASISLKGVKTETNSSMTVPPL